jgi:periplasmic protein TonB
MKLDLLNNQWIDIVFEGRNKSYGAYDLRKSVTSNTTRAFIIGTLIFSFLVSIPTLMRLIPEGGEDDTLDQKITAVKLPPKPKKEEILKNAPPPPPPAPKVDQVKFVKPVVAKAEDVVEEIAVIKDIQDKNIGKETVKGNDEAQLTVEAVGTGDAAVVQEEDNGLYSLAGLEVLPEFPGGDKKFGEFIGRNFVAPEDAPSGKILVSFVVEKDGSLTDVKIVRDLGYGTGAEALRVFKKIPKWIPGEQNGRKVRVPYTIPIIIQAQE